MKNTRTSTACRGVSLLILVVLAAVPINQAISETGQEADDAGRLSTPDTVFYEDYLQYRTSGQLPTDTAFVSKQWHLRQTALNQPYLDRLNIGADIDWLPAWWIYESAVKADTPIIMIADHGIAMTIDGQLCNPDLMDTNRIILGGNYIEGGIPRESLLGNHGNGHGTGMAGVAAAAGNTADSFGIIGVCPDCRLHITRVCPIHDYIVPDSMAPPDIYLKLAWAFTEAIESDVDVIVTGVCAMGFPPDTVFYNDTTIQDLFLVRLDSLKAHGIIFVAPGDYYFNYLVSEGYTNIFTINGTGYDDKITHTSGQDPVEYYPFLSVPDVSIWCNANCCDTAWDCDTSGHARLQSGQCFAVPQVGGVIGMMKTIDPDLTYTEIRTILAATADPVWQWNGDPDSTAPAPHPVYGYGRLNAFRALMRVAMPEYSATGKAGLIRGGDDTLWEGTIDVLGDVVVPRGRTLNTLAATINYPGGDIYKSIADPDISSASIVYLDSLPCECRPGDANGDTGISVADATYIINYVFKGGPPPVQYSVCNGDANDDCGVNLADAVYLIAYIFKGGEPPRGCDEWHSTCPHTVP